jgi:hypothetical protein
MSVEPDSESDGLEGLLLARGRVPESFCNRCQHVQLLEGDRCGHHLPL